ncbi:MAG: hypothetical protein ACTS3F_00865 [Phycisphaerales bacterium]
MSAHTKRRTRPRTTLSLAALLSGAVIACAFGTTHEATTARAAHDATHPPITTHLSDLHMRDLIPQALAIQPLTAAPAKSQPQHEPAPLIVDRPLNLLSDIGQPEHWAHIHIIPDTHLPPHHRALIDSHTTIPSAERLAIRPLHDSPTAYTRNALMLEGHDRLVIHPRPYSDPNTDQAALPAIITAPPPTPRPFFHEPDRWSITAPTPTNQR